ncbi:spore germination lipoprotein GerD [Brevibacillus laterosporus]|uniref:spore germination lipoprotein GerD n=1 Tax=Brevibacillus laterosporus TaxID=1465 RepID=UPI000CE2DD3D|nr:spore germination lipoprotein GerD [Brevibacillus laterosporus]AYB40281.1 spore gernimation protein [Brevibacillus laterosporus]MBG9772268.1 spore gernimation protein [Brevibacillus laterosporus]MBM7109891.1 Spore germination protein GerD precursor [Brevibacillus laterosporus]PPA81371.1 spore gernimation protein [Brevibacillus laterosporus]
MLNKHFFVALIPVLACGLLLSSCGTTSQNQSQPDYKSTKTMVLDILQTDEAKKTMESMMKDESFQKNLIMNPETVRTTLIQSIAKPNNPHIKQAFKDPKFTSTLAKSMKAENKKLLKELMKDPEYQQMMLSILKDPEYEKSLLDLMKTSAYRKQTMQIMKDSLESPMFQAEMLKIMTKAQEDMMNPQHLNEETKGKKQGKKKKSGGE